MFRKKIWIPIVGVLVAGAIGVAFWWSPTSTTPVKVYKSVDLKKTVVPETSTAAPQGARFDAEEMSDTSVSDSGVPQHRVPDLDTIPQVNIDTTSHLAAIATEGPERLEEPTHQDQTPSQQQIALYRQQVEQYKKDREKWNRMFHQAFSERMQAGKDLFDLIPDGSPEDLQAYFDNLSVAEKLAFQAEVRARYEKIQAAIKKLETVEQERPVLPERI